jgi:MFS family permease
MTAEVATLTQPVTELALGRPAARLSTGSLIRISLYWLGLSAVFIGLNQILTGRMEAGLLGPDVKREVGGTLFRLTAAGSVIAAVVQPTVGTLSDYTVSRWGRRKPYIVIGSALDLLFLAGIAFSNTLLAIAACIMLLQVSSNLAQGPFQGYIPDLVPTEQTGIASSLVGLFSVLGQVSGFGIAAAAIATGSFAVGTLALGVLEFSMMFSVVLHVPAGPPARGRGGRSWASIAREAWGADILRHRSFVLIVLSRLLILMGGTMLINFSTLFLIRTLGIAQHDTFAPNMTLLIVVVAGNLLAVIPAGRVGDRIGRRPVVWVACAMAAFGMGLVAAAKGTEGTLPVQAVLGAALFGTGLGSFLSVDWALLTSVVPGAAGGRYMGISNVATAMAGVLGIASGGPLLDAVDAARYGDGPRAAFALAVVFLLLGMLPLLGVKEPPRVAVAAHETAPTLMDAR